MTIIGYIFLDVNRDDLISLEQQRHAIEKYAHELNLTCAEILVEQKYSPVVPLIERNEGSQMVENMGLGDIIIVMHARWVLGNPKASLSLLKILKEKQISLYCVDLAGNISMPTQRKLVSSKGISTMVTKLCEALSYGESSKHGAAIRATKARLKKEGKYAGGPVPYGWQVGENGKLQQEPNQQSFISEMVRLKNDRWSYRDISIKMEEEHGLKLSHEGIRRILLKNSQSV
jgi:DNA invertase Pin-like site-specific DNA recombinase